MTDSVSLTIDELLTNAQLFAKDADEEHVGVMIAFFVDEPVASQLTAIKGVTEKPEELHLTLAYLGSRDTLADTQIAAAILATQNMARSTTPISGAINGIGRFNASQSSEGKDVLYAVVDIPGLDDIRQMMTNILSDRDSSIARTHGYTPHITLAYIDTGADSPIKTVPTIPLIFNRISIVVAGRRLDFPLSGMHDARYNAQEAAEAGEETVAAQDIADAAIVDSAPATVEQAEDAVVEPVVNAGIKQEVLLGRCGSVVGGTLEFVVNTNLVRTVQKNGREYLVAPSVAIKEGVLNGEFVPASEIEKFALAWNGRPVPLGHPKDDVGHVSANTPDLWDLTPAFFWNAEAKGGALTGEIWFDVDKAKSIGGLAVQAEAALRQGLSMELSTAYFRDFEEGSGMFGGKSYSGTARNLRPDHIALLLDEPGACSWADGCGAPRVNSAAHDAASHQFISEGVRALTHKVKQLVNPERISPMDREKMIGTLVANKACKCTEEQLTAMDDATLQAVADTVPAVNEEAAVVVEELTVVEAPAAVATPLPQSVVDFAALLEKMGGVEKLAATLDSVVANSNKEHDEIVRRLVANKSCTLDEAELKAMPVETLRKLATSFGTRNYSGNAGSIVGNAFASDEDDFVPMAMPTIKKEGK